MLETRKVYLVGLWSTWSISRRFLLPLSGLGSIGGVCFGVSRFVRFVAWYGTTVRWSVLFGGFVLEQGLTISVRRWDIYISSLGYSRRHISKPLLRLHHGTSEIRLERLILVVPSVRLCRDRLADVAWQKSGSTRRRSKSHVKQARRRCQDRTQVRAVASSPSQLLPSRHFTSINLLHLHHVATEIPKLAGAGHQTAAMDVLRMLADEPVAINESPTKTRHPNVTEVISRSRSQHGADEKAV